MRTPPKPMSRRALLGLLAVGGLGACARKASPVELPPDAGTPRDGCESWTTRELIFDEGPGAPQRVVVLGPRAPREARLPLLIALHGRGESSRGLQAGAWGWVRDYALGAMAERLERPPLGPEALHGVGDDAYRAALNEGLRAGPFRGLFVACPYTPDILASPGLDGAEPFGRFLVERLLPRLRRELPVLNSRAATGIDGVSLGGRVALLVGLRHAEAFGAIGTLQAAIREHEVPELTQRGRALLTTHPTPPRLRLLTSTFDPFRPTIERLAGALAQAGWPAELKVVPGPHNYAFNRGPGGAELLLWHDRMLRAEVPEPSPAAR